MLNQLFEAVSTLANKFESFEQKQSVQTKQQKAVELLNSKNVPEKFSQYINYDSETSIEDQVSKLTEDFFEAKKENAKNTLGPGPENSEGAGKLNKEGVQRFADTLKKRQEAKMQITTNEN